MNVAMRTSAVALLVAALMAGAPAIALADPEPPLLVDASISPSDGSSATVSTTGTTAGADVPAPTASVGTTPSLTSPDLSTASTGSGAATTDRSVATSGTGLAPSGTTVTTSATSPGAPATLSATDREQLAQGASVGVAASEPLSASTLSGSTGASVLLCSLASASADETRATLSSLCGGAASSVGGGLSADVANAPTGTRVTSDAVIRAAICVLGQASSPLSGTVDRGNVASGSLSTLCGGGASTAETSGGTGITSERTSSSLAARPAVSLALCLLANGTTGDPTVAQLTSQCGPTIGATAPTGLSDGTTASGVGLAPAASAAACLLASALAGIPADPAQPGAVADLTAACGTGTGTTPSGFTATSPSSMSMSGGSTADLAPSVRAAMCILARAEPSLANTDPTIEDACAGVASSPLVTGSGPAAGAADGSAGPDGSAGSVDGAGTSDIDALIGLASIGGPLGPALAALAGIADGLGIFDAAGLADLAGLAGLPSSSTGPLSAFGLMLAGLASLAVLARRRHG